MRKDSERKRVFLGTALPAASLLLAVLLAAVGCGSSGKVSEPAEEGRGETAAQEEIGMEAAEREKLPVTLKLYFLTESDGDLFLGVEEREVPYTKAVARAAMEELIKGPSAGSGLRGALPPTVRVLGVSVQDGVCAVDVSKEIITDKPPGGGAGAQVEALALASIANTLTEFPTVQRVRLLVEGRQSGIIDGRYIEDFWGHVGLPEFLERDPGVIGPR